MCWQLDAEEALDFYVDTQKYALLFTEQDRRETAQRLWTRYIDAKADRLVTMPDDITRNLQKEILDNKSAAPDLFKKAVSGMGPFDTVHLKVAAAAAAARVLLGVCCCSCQRADARPHIYSISTVPGG